MFCSYEFILNSIGEKLWLLPKTVNQQDLPGDRGVGQCKMEGARTTSGSKMNTYFLSRYGPFTGSTNTTPPNWLESRTPTIFLVAGVRFVGYAGVKVTRLVTNIAVPDVVSVSAGTLGLLVLASGLLGFYPPGA